MIKCSYFAGKTVVVFGMSRTGIGATKTMIASSAHVIASDDNEETLKTIQNRFPTITTLAPLDIDWSKAEFLILSPGVPIYGNDAHPIFKLANDNGVTIIADFDVLYLACPGANFIGITGTNGKSTTTALIGHILDKCGKKVQVGGNIGIPVLDLEPQDDGFYVLELSSFQLDLIKFMHLDTALFINITPDHIDRHGTFENYLKSKSKIINLVHQNGFGVISIDYDGTKELATKLNHKITISTSNANADIYIKDRVLYDKKHNLEFSFVDYSYLPGKHNEENIAAAYAVSSAQGLVPDQIISATKNFKGLKHRIETIFESSRFKFINDSKATNAEATEKALQCFSDIYWIAGGVAKEGGIEKILPLIRERVRLTLLIGQAQNEFAESLSKMQLPFVKAYTLEQALDYLYNKGNASGTVLLSPACASFDQFKNFEHRGDEFIRLVKEKFGTD
jgi:UDP-N-acetylmuramoylalanine--D-glutamate ligase